MLIALKTSSVLDDAIPSSYAWLCVVAEVMSESSEDGGKELG